MRSTTALLPAGLLALLAAAVTGCSGSSGGKGSTAAANSAPGSTSANSTSGAPASAGSDVASGNAAPTQPQLAKIVLQATDLPAGWTSAPATGASASDAVDQKKLTTCLGTRDTYADRVARADSNDFAKGETEISSNAISFKSKSDVDSDVAMLHNPKIDQCFTQLANSELTTAAPSGATVKDIKLHFTGRAAGQPDNVVANETGSFLVEAQNHQGTAYLDIAFIRGPQVEAEVQFVSLGSRVDATLRNQLVGKVAQRAKG